MKFIFRLMTPALQSRFSMSGSKRSNIPSKEAFGPTKISQAITSKFG